MQTVGELRSLPENSASLIETSARQPRGLLLHWSVWTVILFLAAYSPTSPNGLLTSFAVVTLPMILEMLWVRGEPPVLAFACAMQWLQASAAIFYTDYSHISLAQAFGTHQLEAASWLSLTSVLILAGGMRVALLRRPRSRQKVLEHDGARVNVGKTLAAYAVSFVVGLELTTYAWVLPGLTQLLLPIAAIKWLFVFIIAYSVLERQKGYVLLAGILLFEVGTGLLGYFAGFKSVFFIIVVAALASPLALRGRRLVLVLFIFISLSALGIFWSAIKMEYRESLNEGSGMQTVTMPVEERATKLSELVDRFTWQDFNYGLDVMVLRVSYVYYFALAMINVPDSVPYENGALWMGTLKHSLMPRLFFPEKATLDDSERTMLYTGLMVGGAEQGTSIGIGYVGESYVDFGPRWMFLPIALLGIFYGMIYRVFAVNSRYALVGTAVAAAILVFGAYTIETSNVKLVGGNLCAVLVFGGLYLLFGKVLHRWLTS
jgi:hypothetical protein